MQTASGRSDGVYRRGMITRGTTRRGHQVGHLTWCMSAPAEHANAPDRVHTGSRQCRLHVALGSNTSREARQQAPGQIANEKWLTARQSATMRSRQRLYFQYMPYCSGRRKTTVGRDILRHCVTRRIYRTQRSMINTLALVGFQGFTRSLHDVST